MPKEGRSALLKDLFKCMSVKSTACYRYEDISLKTTSFFVDVEGVSVSSPVCDTQISEVENRLGVTLPDELKHLYRYRNGGMISSRLIVPVVNNPTPSFSDWRPAVSQLFEPKLPLVNELCWLDNLLEGESDRAWPLPAEARHYLVLNRRSTDFTLLDYSKRNNPEPRVVLINFDPENADTNWPNAEFDSFDIYLKSMRLVTETYIDTNALSTTPPPEPHYYIKIEDTPLCVETFYRERFSAHRSDELFGYPPERPRGWITTPEMIQEAEERLNIVLPPLLRKLYEYQNGGDLDELWVPTKPNPGIELEDWRGVFAYGYDELSPLEGLCTLFDCALSFMSPEEAEEGIGQCPFLPSQAKRYIVLSQRYHDTTFLDYSNSNEHPRVGIVEFEGLDPVDIWFESFDDFFHALRRGSVEIEDP